jgi:UMF1 family MFS transporter
MTLVNVERGRSDAAALAKTLEDDDDDDDNLSQEIRNDLRGSVSYQRS